jgi:hypothetical protein
VHGEGDLAGKIDMTKIKGGVVCGYMLAGVEALKGDLAGFHSIRINDQWRLIFDWQIGGVYDVAIVDYH